jgi:hypothetical protein
MGSNQISKIWRSLCFLVRPASRATATLDQQFNAVNIRSAQPSQNVMLFIPHQCESFHKAQDHHGGRNRATTWVETIQNSCIDRLPF